MPKRRYEHHEPTHEWKQIQPQLKDTAQINYEVIRPVILWESRPKNVAQKQGVTAHYLLPRQSF